MKKFIIAVTFLSISGLGFSQTQQVKDTNKSDEQVMAQTQIIVVNAGETEKYVNAPSPSISKEESTLDPLNVGFIKTTINKKEAYQKIIDNLTILFYSK